MSSHRAMPTTFALGKISVGQSLALSESSEIFVTNDSYISVIFALENFSVSQRKTGLQHEDCFLSPWPQVIFFSKREFSMKRPFPVNHAPFCSSLCVPAVDTKIHICVHISVQQLVDNPISSKACHLKICRKFTSIDFHPLSSIHNATSQ